LREVTITVAPSFPKRYAVEKPMPEEAPVKRTILSLYLNRIFSMFLVGNPLKIYQFNKN